MKKNSVQIGAEENRKTYLHVRSTGNAEVVSLLGRFCHVEPIIGMKHPYYYRNKVQAALPGTETAGLPPAYTSPVRIRLFQLRNTSWNTLQRTE